MCGIAGIASERADPGHAIAAERMVATLAHRGPNSHGVEDLGPCVLANTRLAIVDLSERGRQPMCNEDGTVWIAYNGECYNAAELRPMLVQRGHQFRSSTDTEVVLHLYEEFGEECAGKLRGMFAFAIWDSRSRKLFLARDRLGIKPLYYRLGPGTAIFASEIKALLASELVPRKLDPAGIRAYLQLGHIPPPRTALQGVQPLAPGHIGIWQDGHFQTRAYWTLPVPGNGSSRATPAEISDSLREVLAESTRVRLMSDVPIALFLSGGIDSAVLGALMRNAGADQLTALTIGFEEKAFDESEASRQTAEALGIPHRVIRMSPSAMSGSLDHAIWAMDQPTVDGLNAYWISRAAAEAGFKVALSGQGGDELFGGYESLAWFDRFAGVADWLRPLPSRLGRGVFDHESLPFRWRKLSYLVGADDPFVAAQLAVRIMFLEGDTQQLLHPALAPARSEFEAKKSIAAWAQQTAGLSLQERIAYLDFPAHLEARLLRDGDAMSMAHSLEVRPLFLDHKVVEFVMRLPMSLRRRKKQLLLEATRGSIPAAFYDELVSRPKQTFTFPFSQWLAASMRPVIDETFGRERLAAVGVLDPGGVARLWKRYLERPGAVGWSRLWCIFVLARWCELMGVGV